MMLEIIDELGQAATGPGSIYIVGGGTAVLFDMRDSTIDIDLAFAPEPKGIFASIEAIKRKYQINIELASPADFVPPLPGWQSRSPFIKRMNLVDFYHYDPYSQAFAKISRSHQRDLHDLTQMIKLGLVEPVKLKELVNQLSLDEFARYPQRSAAQLKTMVDRWASSHG